MKSTAQSPKADRTPGPLGIVFAGIANFFRVLLFLLIFAIGLIAANA